MPPPVPILRVDWANDGTFDGPLDTVHPIDDPPLVYQRGRSGDFTADATGQLTFVLDNTDDAYSPDRNWHDNPSFEVDTAGWSVAATPGFTSDGTSLAKVIDNAPGAGSSAGEVVLPAVAGAGAVYAIPYRFRAGLTYSIAVSIKSIAGTTSIEAGIGATSTDPADDLAHGMPESGGYPVDQATGAGTISGAWVRYAFSWIPIADRVGAYFFVRSTAALAATFRVDAVQVNPGVSPNPYIEAPTKNQLVPGRPVHLYATFAGLTWPLFYGFIERITPDLQGRKVTFSAYDVFRRMSETDVVVPSMPFVSRSGRDLRIEALSDFERGVRNLLLNPEFAVDLAGWSVIGGNNMITRLATGGPSVSSGTCAELLTVDTSSVLRGQIRLAPVFFAGQIYRFSVYLRAPSPLDVEIGVSTAAGNTAKTVSVASDWTRFSIAWSVPTTVTASDGQAPTVYLRTPTNPGTVRLGAVSVTRGQALYPYAAVGAGRWPNWCGNGSFDGGLNGWYNGFSNFCTNPSFETDTAGWSVAADAFHAAATSITRASVGGAALGTFYGDVALSAPDQGVHFALVGTFRAGITYRVSMSVWAGAARTWEVGIGSQSNPIDKASVSVNVGTTWTNGLGPTWTPTADRTDAHVYVKATGATAGMRIDAVDVVEADPARTRQVSDCLIALPFATHGTIATGQSTVARYGNRSQSMTTIPIVGSGRLYALDHLGGLFSAGQPFTLSLWLWASSDMPYRVGLAAALNLNRSSWDSISTSGVAPAAKWTQVALTWTPSADAPAPVLFGVTFQEIISVEQTDAVSRTVLVDGVRLIPGLVTDNFEQPYWDIAPTAEAEIYGVSSAVGGSALSALQAINAASLSRHWIVADMATPFYRYRVQDRGAYAVSGSAERFGDVQALSAPEIDRQALINTTKAVTQGFDYISDENSVARFGQRPGPDIGGGTISAGPTDVAAIAAAVNTRYRDPIRRPTFTVENRWPSQLQREVGDAVWIVIDPWLIRSLFGTIARLTTTISQAGQHWKTDYQLEESSLADGAYGSLSLALPE